MKFSLIIFGIVILISCNSNQVKTRKTQNTISTNGYPPNDDDTAFIKYWEDFRKILISHDIKMIRKNCLDSLQFNGNMILSQTFLSTYFDSLFDKAYTNKLVENKDFRFRHSAPYHDYFSEYFLKQIKKEKYYIKMVNLEIGVNELEKHEIDLYFIEIDSEHKFYGYTDFWPTN